AAGHIPSVTRGYATGAWIVALLWNLISRNPAVAAGVTLISLIFCTPLYFLVVLPPSIFLPITIFLTVMCAITDAALLFAVIMLWLLRRRVTIENRLVTIRSSVLGIARTREIPCADISDLKLGIGMQSGGGEGTPYYNI